MAINIRNPETLAALRALARATGNPMTTELDTAVHERLARLQEAREDRMRRLQDIAARASAGWKGPRRGDPSAFLYGADGMPA